MQPDDDDDDDKQINILPHGHSFTGKHRNSQQLMNYDAEIHRL